MSLVQVLVLVLLYSFPAISLMNDTAQTSNQSSIHNSSTTASSFSYIIPYDRTQACDIYGPVCQTGSITVAVNLSTTTTTTVLPCASYLTAQSAYITAFDPSHIWEPNWPREWDINFGRSPECRSYVQASNSSSYTLSGCGYSNSVFSGNPLFSEVAQIPPGIIRRYDPDEYAQCCGECDLSIRELRLYYFPDEPSPGCVQNQTLNDTSAVSAAGKLVKREQSPGDGSVAVLSGKSFTSPSLYLQVVGTAAVNDQCGPLDPVLTNPIITLRPGQLSTWAPTVSTSASEIFAPGMTFDVIASLAIFSNYGTFAPLNVADLACPTFGLGRDGVFGGTTTTTIGPPFLPVLVPPGQAVSLDPTWTIFCSGIRTDYFATNFLIFDPPTALTPQSRLVPPPTTTSSSTPAVNQADPTTAAATSATSITSIPDPPSPPSDPDAPAIQTRDPRTSQGTYSTGAHSSGSSPTTNTGPSVYEDPPPSAGSEVPAPINQDPPINPQENEPEDSSNVQSLGLGAIIYNAWGGSGPSVGWSPNNVKVVPLPAPGVYQLLTAENKILTMDSSGVNSDGTQYSAGGPALTISDQVYTFVPHKSDSGGVAGDPVTNPATPIDSLTTQVYATILQPSSVFIDGSSAVLDGQTFPISEVPAFITPPAPGISIIRSSGIVPAPQSVFTIGAQTFTANTAGFVLDGETISPGGSPETIDGTVISLGSLGKLAIGSSTFTIPTPIMTDPANLPIVVAGKTVTPNTSAFYIAGTMVSVGGPAVTIDGTTISLGPFGSLSIGGTVYALPTSTLALSSGPDLVVAGHTITPNPSAFQIAGTKISAGGSLVTVDGTVVSLGPSGSLVIGSATITLPTTTPTEPSDPHVVVACETITPNWSDFSIAGTVVSAGGPPITVNGTLIRLQRSGTLVVGSSTLTLPAPSPSGTDVDGLEVQAQGSFAVVNGVTVMPGQSGISIAGDFVSLEAGGKTLDIGTDRFALPTTSANGTAGLQVFDGGQGRGMGMSFSAILVAGVIFMMKL